MKKTKWIVSLVLILTLLMGLAVTASADADTQYEVTISGGKWGTDKGTISVTAGSTLDLSSYAQGDATYTKNGVTRVYKFNGYHEAGSQVIVSSAVISRDTVFVASFFVPGKMTTYTLNFLEYGTNKVLHDPITYSGNVGDKPIAAYIELEGYTPQGAAITGTLKEGANNWPLYYFKNEAAPTPTPVPANNNQNQQPANQQPANQQPANQQPANQQPENQQPANQQPANQQPAPAPVAPNPDQIIDIDDPNAPLAGPVTPEPSSTPDPNSAAGQNEQNKKTGWLYTAVGSVSLVAILLGLWAALARKKKSNVK